MKLYGKNPVLERIKTDPGSIEHLYLQKRTDLSEIVRAAKEQGLDFESVDRQKFLQICGDVHSQGVIAKVAEYEYMPFDQMLSHAKKNDIIPVFLDGITDPQNLGSIIRNIACLGGFSIVLSEHRSARVTETVLRVACGGENYINISSVVNTVKGVVRAKEAGFRILGAAVEDGTDLLEYDIENPIAVVIGSEGKGIRPGIRQHIDKNLYIPMRGAPLSYNVAVATSLFCHELNRKRPA